jgi:hypothetical protein
MLKLIFGLTLAFGLITQASALEAGKWIILGTIYVHGEQEKFITLAYNEKGKKDPILFDSEDACGAFKDTNREAQKTFDQLSNLAAGHEDVFFDVHCVRVPAFGKDT